MSDTASRPVSVVPFEKATLAVSDATREIGSTSTDKWGDGLSSEFLRELRGEQGVKTYREMSKNDAVVGASLFAYENLARGVSFEVVSAEPGDVKADEAAEFVRGALFDDMSISWRDLVGEILTFLTYGWSYFEVVYKIRGGMDTGDPTRRSRFSDNRIGWRKWALRKQDTLVAWDMDANGGLQGMIQRAGPNYQRVTIPIAKSLLFRTSLDGGNPEGESLLRTAYIPWYHKRRIQIIRGIGIERDLAGLPVLTPPEGVNPWNPKDAAQVAQKTAAERIVRNIRRDENEGIVKPYGWELELLSSSGSRQFDITEVIAQLNAEIAMSMMTDFLLIGHEKVGARSLSEDKRAMFGHAANSFLTSICDVINRFAIPPLMELNGIAQELQPKLKNGPVAEISLDSLSTFVKNMVGVGVIVPDPDLEKHIRERAYLPPPIEDRDPIIHPLQEKEEEL